MYRGPLIMYSFKYTRSTCKYFIEIKSQIVDYCLSVRNDETRICKKYLFAVSLESCYVRSNRSCNIRLIMDVHNVCPHGKTINTLSMLVALPCGHTFWTSMVVLIFWFYLIWHNSFPKKIANRYLLQIHFSSLRTDRQ